MSKTENHDIVVVEDDLDLGTMMQILLERINFKVIKFEHHDKFLTYIQNHEPRVIVMDMLLSGANGCDLCRLVKSDPQKKHIRIVMVSAHPDAKKACLEAGADSFIEKPFEIEFFIQTVKNHFAVTINTT